MDSSEGPPLDSNEGPPLSLTFAFFLSRGLASNFMILRFLNHHLSQKFMGSNSGFLAEAQHVVYLIEIGVID
jgi:hypothetical protein